MHWIVSLVADNKIHALVLSGAVLVLSGAFMVRKRYFKKSKKVSFVKMNPLTSEDIEDPVSKQTPPTKTIPDNPINDFSDSDSDSVSNDCYVY
tara:strand:+ start:885 stop:1163 length:279 start_codon:yes stop_codon:yes gene_type:complete